MPITSALTNLLKCRKAARRWSNQAASAYGATALLLHVEYRCRAVAEHQCLRRHQTINEAESNSTMTTLRNAALALITLALSGCAEQQPQVTTTTTTTKTTQITQVISLKIGMKGSEAVAQAGIPCSSSTIKSIDAGDNVMLNYQGHAYVFSKGALQAVH